MATGQVVELAGGRLLDGGAAPLYVLTDASHGVAGGHGRQDKYAEQQKCQSFQGRSPIAGKVACCRSDRGAQARMARGTARRAEDDYRTGRGNKAAQSGSPRFPDQKRLATSASRCCSLASPREASPVAPWAWACCMKVSRARSRA